jgi:hypothetical protein
MPTLIDAVYKVAERIAERNQIEERRVAALEFRNQIEVMRVVVEYSHGAGGLGAKDLADRSWDLHKMIKDGPHVARHR